MIDLAVMGECLQGSNVIAGESAGGLLHGPGMRGWGTGIREWSWDYQGHLLLHLNLVHSKN